MTPIARAAEMGSLLGFERLIALGADKTGLNVLQYALCRAHALSTPEAAAAVIEELLFGGAAPLVNSSLPSEPTEAFPEHADPSKSLVEGALILGSWGVAALLLAAGALPLPLASFPPGGPCSAQLVLADALALAREELARLRLFPSCAAAAAARLAFETAVEAHAGREASPCARLRFLRSSAAVPAYKGLRPRPACLTAAPLRVLRAEALVAAAHAARAEAAERTVSLLRRGAHLLPAAAGTAAARRERAAGVFASAACVAKWSDISRSVAEAETELAAALAALQGERAAFAETVERLEAALDAAAARYE